MIQSEDADAFGAHWALYCISTGVLSHPKVRGGKQLPFGSHSVTACRRLRWVLAPIWYVRLYLRTRPLGPETSIASSCWVVPIGVPAKKCSPWSGRSWAQLL